MEEHIHEAISRMSDFQMRIKGLSIAVTSATILVNVSSWFSILLVTIILIALWVLDSYYLSIERKLRSKVEDFGSRELREKEGIMNNLFGKSVAIFHCTFVGISILVLINSILQIV